MRCSIVKTYTISLTLIEGSIHDLPELALAVLSGLSASSFTLRVLLISLTAPFAFSITKNVDKDKRIFCRKHVINDEQNSVPSQQFRF